MSKDALCTFFAAAVTKWQKSSFYSILLVIEIVEARNLKDRDFKVFTWPPDAMKTYSIIPNDFSGPQHNYDIQPFSPCYQGTGMR